ncbi:scavenger receptor cysteine-rich domain-containing protein DMBT1-like [Amphiura filiformis]|uniref:scavenger receptor cysteine-rich domain-containing protein DMBT1-like n=1 Tax=Amphiura filiformis TaxID=82378 RepID=UPI003B2239CA
MANDIFVKGPLFEYILCVFVFRYREGSLQISPVDNRLEIYHDGVYGTICDDLWTYPNSLVACRQLNFTFVNQTKTVDTDITGDIPRPIWLDNVECTGTENTLAECTRNEWGDQNCGHYEDISVTCLDASDSQLRLTEDSAPNAGIVELYYDGKWGAICDDNFDDNDAAVVCRQLGYSGVESWWSAEDELFRSSRIWLDELECVGDEDNILSCPHRGLGVHDCAAWENVVVVCLAEEADNECFSDSKARDYRGTVATTKYGNTCQKWTEQEPNEHDRTVENYPGYGLGDHNYCRNPDNEPEGAWCFTIEGPRWEYCDIGSPRPCDISDGEEGSLRISEQDGRLEIYHDNEWGTICDDGWGHADSVVACKQLGQRFVNKSFTAEPASEELPIWMDNVECVGSEETLVDCDRNPWGVNNCGPSENIGVQCIPDGEYEVRLSGGASSNEGRVEINIDGEWGTMCDDDFGDEDAVVICRQLGYSNYIRWETTTEVGSGPIWLDNINCAGTEEHIMDCQHNGLGSTNCGHSEDIQVTCLDDTEQIPEGTVRLMDGLNDAEGRVEIFYQGEWGTICDDNWGFFDAQVVCRDLGFPGAKRATLGGSVPVGTGPILLDEVDCDGTEMRLVNCSNPGWNVHNCGHSEDVGVICFTAEEEPPRLRLINANGEEGTNEGRVEVYYDGAWGTVCDDSWSIENGNVVCKQLGFENGAISISTAAQYGEGSGDILLDDVTCSGEESALGYCMHSGYGVNNCGHSEDAGVLCDPGMTGPTVEVQLVGGTTPFEGRVEITKDGVTGTICDDDWGIKDATVICRMLGYAGAKAAITAGAFGQGTGDILLDNVACEGTEATIASCVNRGWGVSDCSHSEDAGVICYPESEILPLAVRLRDGTSPNNGRVEVYVDGQWGTVCDDLWDKLDADVICKRLGYKDAIEILASSEITNGAEEMPILFDNVECNGKEDGIEFCEHANVGTDNCGHSEDVGVRCREWENGDLRLAKGTAKNVGRLEVFYDGQWGQVCDDGFTLREANVACRQLGFTAAEGYASDNFYGSEGLTDIFLDNVVCTGEETKLADCANLGWRQHNCFLAEAVDITCNDITLPPILP